jgi:hypothetical protein
MNLTARTPKGSGSHPQKYEENRSQGKPPLPEFQSRYGSKKIVENSVKEMGLQA